MRVAIAMLMIFLGFIIAFLLKSLVNNGCHHTAHCIEVALLAIALIAIIADLYEQLVIVAISVALFRNLFRVIADCCDIAKKHRLSVLEKKTK